MIVADASVVLEALLDDGPSRSLLRSTETIHVPHLCDSEVAHALRRAVAMGAIDEPTGRAALVAIGSFGLLRHGVHGLAERIWELRDDVTAYDGAYVALAEAIGGELVTTDRRLSRAPGLECPVTLMPAA